MDGRLIAIGDIHGCVAALDALLELIDPQASDTLVFLGDYVDRGPASRQVLDRVIGLAGHCRLVPLVGNHDEMFLEICQGALHLLDDWLDFGGRATVASYGRVPEDVPQAHLDFLHNCRLYYETQRHFFVHGNYLEELPLAAQTSAVLLWESLRQRLPGPHSSGKTAILGHTAQKTGEVLELGYLKCIDTYCYGTGWLTALAVEAGGGHSGHIWQADRQGRVRG